MLVDKNKPIAEDFKSRGEEFLRQVVEMIEGTGDFSPKLLVLLSPKNKKLFLDAVTNFAFADAENGSETSSNVKSYSWLARERGIKIDFAKDATFHRKPGMDQGCIVYVCKDIEYSPEQKEKIREEKIPQLEKANYSVHYQHLHSTIKSVITGDIISFVKEFDPFKRESELESFKEDVKNIQESLAREQSEEKEE